MIEVGKNAGVARIRKGLAVRKRAVMKKDRSTGRLKYRPGRTMSLGIHNPQDHRTTGPLDHSDKGQVMAAHALLVDKVC